MKATLLFLPLVAYASTIPLESRQLGSLTGLGQKGLKTEYVEPTIPRAGAKRVKIWYGPYNIRAANGVERLGNAASMDPAGTSYSYILDDIPKDITILGTNMTVVYEDGSDADLKNGIYNHHTYLANMAKSAPSVLSCVTGTTPRPISLSVFSSAATEYGGFYFTSPDAKVNSGYYVGKNDRISSVIDLVNYADKVQTVYVVNDIQYVEGKVPESLDTSMQIINLGMCDGSAVSIQPPAGQTKFSLKSSEMQLTQSGRLLSMWGHVHDGGLNIIAKINGKEVCNSQAIYGGAGATLGTGMGGMGMGGMGDMGEMTGAEHSHGEEPAWETVSSMTQCFDMRVSKGDTFSLEAFYDLEQHPARQHLDGGMAEEMAIMTTFFAIDK